MDVEVIWVSDEEKYFCERGWTAKSQTQPVGQISSYPRPSLPKAKAPITSLQASI
jgi:hypothetical protein